MVQKIKLDEETLFDVMKDIPQEIRTIPKIQSGVEHILEKENHRPLISEAELIPHLNSLMEKKYFKQIIIERYGRKFKIYEQLRLTYKG